MKFRSIYAFKRWTIHPVITYSNHLADSNIQEDLIPKLQTLLFIWVLSVD